MTSNRGVLYIAYGKEYDNVAAHSAKRIREFSDIPIHVVTNVSSKTNIWDKFINCSFTYINDKDESNRVVKCQPDVFSPFDETLYVDCDTVVNTKKFLDIFDHIKCADIAMPVYTMENSFDRFRRLKLYKQAFQDFKIKEMPRVVYMPGVLVFKKNERTRKLFDTWYEYWSLRKLRDMPPLVCAVINNPDVIVAILSEKEYGMNRSSIISHYNGIRLANNKYLPNFKKPVVSEWMPLGKMEWKKFDTFKEKEF